MNSNGCSHHYWITDIPVFLHTAAVHTLLKQQKQQHDDGRNEDDEEEDQSISFIRHFISVQESMEDEQDLVICR